MDKLLNSKKETESIYEIYRACRLCGGGAGYKMPIIQNIVDLDEADVELKQKIRDCVQIEVHQDDKMPPLICELCVDKVNDFYEFLEMCRQTNKRTRLRLGLPPQSLSRGTPDAGDCILGLTEPVYVNDDSDGEPLSKQKKVNKTKVVKREPIVRIKIENLEAEHLHKLKSSSHSKTPQRVTRHSKSKDEDITLSALKDKKSSKVAPKSILKKENNNKNDESLLSSRLKRLRDKETVKLDIPQKKVKITTKSPPPSPPALRQKVSPKTSPRLVPKKPLRPLRSPVASPPKRPPSPPKEALPCAVCGQSFKNAQARSNHMRIHLVTFTNPKLACNPCEEWFPSLEDMMAHQRWHKNKHIPFVCWKCQSDFKRLLDYDAHIENNECLLSTEVPDMKCDACWHLFPTYNLLEDHKCMGEDYRPGGKCSKCSRSYALLKNLKKHESTCTAKKKGELIIDKYLLDQLRPIQVRVARCDPLLVNVKQEHYNVSCVSPEYGLDRNCHYPYISSLRIKPELPMVNIEDEVKNEFCSEDYVHWDSEDSDDEISCDAILNPDRRRKRVDSLSALALKIIFSHRLLGKVPKKRRKLKVEKAFDSILAEEDEVRMDIDNIISNLDDDDKTIDDKSVSSLDLMASYNRDNSMITSLSRDTSNDVAEASLDVSDGAEVSQDVSDAAEASVDVSDAAEASLNESNGAEASLDESNGAELSQDVSDVAELSQDASNDVNTSIDMDGSQSESNDLIVGNEDSHSSNKDLSVTDDGSQGNDVNQSGNDDLTAVDDSNHETVKTINDTYSIKNIIDLENGANSTSKIINNKDSFNNDSNSNVELDNNSKNMSQNCDGDSIHSNSVKNNVLEIEENGDKNNDSVINNDNKINSGITLAGTVPKNSETNRVVGLGSIEEFSFDS